MRVIIFRNAPSARPAVAPERVYRARRRYDAAKAKPLTPAASPETPIMAPEKRPQVLVGGDSFAEALIAGLEADEALRREMTLRTRTVSASGLVRDDFHDWPRTIASLLAEAPPPAALVFMAGLNDRQTLRREGQALAPLSEPWREAYGKRIDAVIAAARNARVPLIWVGLPVVRSEALSGDLAQINAMIRERVAAAGEVFVETYDSFADERGAFAASGPDILGDTVRLRGPDGIHFTPAGQRKLAYFVEKALRKRLEGLPPPPADAPRPTPTPGEVSVLLAPTRPATPALAPKQRPDIGETRPLGGPAGAAQLSVAPAPLADPASEALFTRGISPAPRAGRVDDYRWK